MHTFDAQSLTARENYKLLIGSIIPRPIAFVTTLNQDASVNAAPFSFFNIVNNQPPMIAISVQRTGGKRKDTALNIERTGDFVVHITDEYNVQDINETAAPLAYGDSELSRTELSLVTSTTIKTPGIKDAKMRFECKLSQMILLGDALDGADLIIGEIVTYHIDESIYEGDFKINPHALQAVSRLAGNDYAKLGETFTINRPEK
ncbi:flavin reductase family protein [Staphylococcus schweitzeri]|uniref:Flavin reductase family protein n=1 Tax=Staphylococcus schweitzeri TaxID=1654388 RepID=A0A2K4ALD3_9STAP|nr:flavin reductase family protein [Staphylococcus schweitzeri]MBE2128103.1 flavin reductase family protein [Staphylococcus schweitzeri]PNZ50879.1 flavin reductase family protein [Staphylococcus schweitzeri]CDR52860.1 nitrilotriacetate monooxygenase component B [Staphylococcus schweitzeri]VEE67112.1 Flavin reductase like domain [Staphylococcus schweitzeri]